MADLKQQILRIDSEVEERIVKPVEQVILIFHSLGTSFKLKV